MALITIPLIVNTISSNGTGNEYDPHYTVSGTVHLWGIKVKTVSQLNEISINVLSRSPFEETAAFVGYVKLLRLISL